MRNEVSQMESLNTPQIGERNQKEHSEACEEQDILGEPRRTRKMPKSEARKMDQIQGTQRIKEQLPQL